MAKVYINHKKLKSTADQVDTYLSNHKANMKKAAKRVEGLKSEWTGDDYYAALAKWRELEGKGSVSDDMIRAMENYRDLLLYAQSQYQKAQSAAINRSLFLF